MLGTAPLGTSALGTGDAPVFDPTLSLAPSVDQPTWSAQALAASAATTISGSPGWLREKRVGVAESAALANPTGQSSTADLDLTGSTRFAYPAQPKSVLGHANGAGNYIQTQYKPGGQPVNAPILFSLDFMTDAPEIEFRLRASVANPRFGLVFVNGKMTQPNAVPNPASITSGAGWAMKATFSTSAMRRITIYGLSAWRGDFGGVAVGAGYTVSKPTAPASPKRIAVISDSYANGAGTFTDTNSSTSGTSMVETFARDLAIKRGATEWLQYGIGGTGWTVDAGGATAGTTTFNTRVADVMAWAPHEVWIIGGRNDPTNGTGVQSALETMIDNIRSYNPSVAIYVSNTSVNTATGLHAAIAAACSNKNAPFYQTDINSLPKISDGIHPSYAGHRQMADNIIAAMGSTSIRKISAGLVGIIDIRVGTVAIQQYVINGNVVWKR